MRIAPAPMVSFVLAVGCCLPLPFEEEAGQPTETPAAGSAPSTPNTTAIAPAAPEVPQTELEAQKVSLYSTRCLNRISRSAFSAHSRYLQWVNPETGPTGRERTVYGVHTMNAQSISRCREGAQQASSMSPSMPELEQAGAAYVAAASALEPLLARADRYYQRETYRDDAMAQGQEMHAPLMAGFEAFTNADRALRSQVEIVQDRARLARIERLANDPARRADYLVERTLAQSVALLRLAADLDVQERRYVSPDQEQLFATVATLRAGVDEVAAHQTSGSSSDFRSFSRAAEDVLESALTLMRRVRDETLFSRSELQRFGTSGGWMTDGSFDELQREYNEMIDTYNRMH